MARMQWPAVIKLQGLTHPCPVFLGARVPAMASTEGLSDLWGGHADIAEMSKERVEVIWMLWSLGNTWYKTLAATCLVQSKSFMTFIKHPSKNRDPTAFWPSTFPDAEWVCHLPGWKKKDFGEYQLQQISPDICTLSERCSRITAAPSHHCFCLSYWTVGLAR